jgi:hypothetical protein
MPRRQILTEYQRQALLDLPTDDASLLLQYTLADDDLVHIRGRRWHHNRLGSALQLCAQRRPGRLLSPGEVIPQEVAQFLAAQLGLGPDDIPDYAVYEEPRHKDVARRCVKECQRTLVILPAVTTIERLSADCLTGTTCDRLETFMTEMVVERVSRFV